MTLLNPYFRSFAGEPVLNRQPAALTVEGGATLTDSQYAGVVSEYGKFCHEIRPSITGYNVSMAKLSDGTVVEFTDIQGRHEVYVTPAGGVPKRLFDIFPAFFYNTIDSSWGRYNQMPSHTPQYGTWTDVPYVTDATPADTLQSRGNFWKDHPGNCTYFNTVEPELEGLVLSWWGPGETQHGTWTDAYMQSDSMYRHTNATQPVSTDPQQDRMFFPYTKYPPLKPNLGKIWLNGHLVIDYDIGIIGASIFKDPNDGKFKIAFVSCGTNVVDFYSGGATIYQVFYSPQINQCPDFPTPYLGGENTGRYYGYGSPIGGGAVTLSLSLLHAVVPKEMLKTLAFKKLQYDYVWGGSQDILGSNLSTYPVELDGVTYQQDGTFYYDAHKTASINASGTEMFIPVCLDLYDAGTLTRHECDGVKLSTVTGKLTGVGPLTITTVNGVISSIAGQPGNEMYMGSLLGGFEIDGTNWYTKYGYTSGSWNSEGFYEYWQYSYIVGPYVYDDSVSGTGAGYSAAGPFGRFLHYAKYDYVGDTLHYCVPLFTYPDESQRGCIYSSYHGILFDTGGTSLIAGSELQRGLTHDPVQVQPFDYAHGSIGRCWVYDLKADYMVFSLVGSGATASNRTVTVYKGVIIEDILNSYESVRAHIPHRAYASSFDGRMFICTVGGAVRVYIDGVDKTSDVENAANIKYPVLLGPALYQGGRRGSPPLNYVKGPTL